MTLTYCQDHILTENIWFLWSETSYCGDERRCHGCGTNNEQPNSEDRATQPMEAGGWVSQYAFFRVWSVVANCFIMRFWGDIWCRKRTIANQNLNPFLERKTKKRPKRTSQCLIYGHPCNMTEDNFRPNYNHWLCCCPNICQRELFGK